MRYMPISYKYANILKYVLNSETGLTKRKGENVQRVKQVLWNVDSIVYDIRAII